MGALLLAAGACSPAPRTGCLINLVLAPQAPRPQWVEVSWWGPVTLLLDREPIAVPPGPDPHLASLFIEAATAEGGPRRLLARGFAGNRIVAEGARGGLDPAPGVILEIEVPLQAGRLPDRDGNGLPDIIDKPPPPRDAGAAPPIH